MIRRLDIRLALVAVGASAWCGISRELNAQSQNRDVGHCVEGARETVNCWNLLAGTQMPEDLSRYSEFLPNLGGWDFRVNLPPGGRARSPGKASSVLASASDVALRWSVPPRAIASFFARTPRMTSW